MGAKPKITAEQQRVRDAIEYLRTYLDTYPSQSGYENYRDETIIDDLLYGIGVALWNNKFANGFRETQARLREHLNKGAV
jgi:hypothetical protein